ncbi:MAG TPA: phosphoenolpyruvate--protein phosphotransferase [Myxococcota bacterium]|nr:phosphoenolpyruvate--protein phosphotransferase [Myxococcota bacterium]HRY95315.1 phosphoenolpyruvate--protein phosphotransferase [Myxococcota bacterium]HSA20769.1 phosphoenolpyruvate--protein phosphotransferase [Myxococcota bacterium]
MSGAKPRVLRGIPASPGIHVGAAFMVDRRRLKIRRRTVPRGRLDEETARFRAALETSVRQLEAIRARSQQAGERQPVAVLEAHLLMLRDESLVQGTLDIIRRDAVNAEWALGATLAKVLRAFEDIQDEYFRERRADVEFVGERVMRNLLGQAADLRPPAGGHAVLVAHELSPADTAGLGRDAVGALVTAAGSRTAHTAIVARALELPAVVGVAGLLGAVGAGDRVIVDGYRGEIVVRPTRAMVREAEERAACLRSRALALVDEAAGPAETPMCLSANIELEEEVEAALRYGAEGVGLFRTEFLFMGRGAPNESQQHRLYERILKRLGDRPATIRTLDMGGDKNPELFRPAPELNPAMGLRSIRLSLRHPGLFLAQLRALLRASTAGTLRILFPLIACPSELERALEYLDQARAQLRARGQAMAGRIEVGMMVEVPSAVMLADSFARQVDFFSLGTNDLIQYALAVDRHNEQLAYLNEPLHPAVLRMLDQVVRAARQAGIRVALCGEMAGEPQNLPVLLGLGLDEISMTPASLPLARHVLRRLSPEATQALWRDLRMCTHPRETERLVKEFLAAHLPDLAC